MLHETELDVTASGLRESLASDETRRTSETGVIDPFLGREILHGQFKLLEKIGTGGMGAVYRAAQPAMNRMVAVKLLHRRLNGRKDLASRFGREARAMSHLSHPNTASVFLHGELEDGSLYLVMELLQGKDLHKTVRANGAFTVARALPIIIQVCGALEEAHAAGIIHRDLKPENIFLCQQGPLRDHPKVIDFGLAKVTEREMRPGSAVLTREGMVLGTRQFMSPEQARGMPVTAKSDIYSLAVVLYEVLTGKLPFDASAGVDYPALHVRAQPISLSRRVPGLTFPPLLDEVLARALEKKPEDRFATASDFARALEAVADLRPPMARELQRRDAPTTLVMADAPRHEPPPAVGFTRTPPTRRPSSESVIPMPTLSQAPPAAHASLGTFVGVSMSCLILGATMMTVVMTLSGR